MKKVILLLYMSCPLLGWSQNSTVLTNADIIKLSSLDLPPSAIISKIKNSQTHFDVGVDSLVELKRHSVNGEVLSEMIAASSREEAITDSKKDLNDPKTMRKHGIYYYNKSDPSHLFIPIDPTVVSSSKSGGLGTRLAQHYSYSIAKNNRISSLSGPHAHREIPHVKPRFYFYLDSKTSISPNEFCLVKLTEKKNSREMTVGSSNAYGASLGIDERDKVSFNYDLVADGIYKVYPLDPLETGEYCFIYTGAAPTMFSNNKVYDFSITEPIH